MIATIGSEWVKLRSVRSTVLTLGAVLLAGGLTLWVVRNGVAAWDGWSPGRRAEVAAAAAASPVPWIGHTTFTLAHLALAVTGTLAAASEYTTGTIRTSLLGTPRRIRWLLAKATTVAGFSVMAWTAVAVPTVLTASVIVGAREISPPYVLGDGRTDALVWAFAGAVVAAVVGLVGLGIGLAVRSMAMAVTVSAGLLLVPGMLAVTLPVSVSSKLTATLLPNLVGQLAGTQAAVAELSPPQAGGVLACYLALTLGAGAVVLHGRDSG